MINLRWVIVVVLATLALVSIASANLDPTPDRSVTVDCRKARQLVAQYGETAVMETARASGVPERVIETVARRCLR